jgi:C4-dicarboxylate-specific signal transduction histidine kinase
MNSSGKTRTKRFYWQLIAVVGTSSIPLIAMSGLLYSIVIADFRANLTNVMVNQITLLASSSESALLFDDKRSAELLLSAFERHSATRYVQIYNADMQLFAEYTSPGVIIDVFFEDFDNSVFFQNDNIYLYERVKKDGQSLGVIVMSANTKNLDTQRRHQLLISLVVLSVSLLLAFLLNWLLQKRLRAPITELNTLVSYISQHKLYDKRLDNPQDNEFRGITVGINAMLNTIEQQAVERDKATAQVIQSSKLATLGEMATSVAHELNQPLNVIRMATGNLRRRISDGTDDPEYLDGKLERIAAQTSRAAAIISHMRMFGREATESPQAVNCPKAVSSAIDLMGEQLRLAGIEIVTDFPEGCPSILGHTIQMEQVILNLFSNARDAIAESDREAKITVRVFEGDKVVHITVQDTGGGIPEDVLPRIFEPFYTTKDMGQGTGLGLSVSYGLVRDMKGTIVAENIADGARFAITLPAIVR